MKKRIFSKIYHQQGANINDSVQNIHFILEKMTTFIK